MSNKIKITIVDDNILITDIFQDYIELLDINASLDIFNDSATALAFIKDNSDIDIIITDYKMPGINGITLLEAAAESTKKVMITGFLSTIASDKLEKLGATYFEKPVPMKKIGKIFNELINKNVTS